MQGKTCTILAGAVLVLVLAMGGLAYGESSPGKININTATIEELQLLPGIGLATAQNIIEYRKANGPFTTMEEFTKVRGIGERKFERLRPYLKLDGDSDFDPVQDVPDTESL
ncbi:MAG: helix-hairpin-helix domain-containing protein [Desulfomonilia bacterium]|jgi:competence protein ComEA